MTTGKPLLWIDIGMAAFVAAFVSIVLFVDGAMFNSIMFVYVVALGIWAFVAESAAMKAEGHGSSIGAGDYTRDASRSEPLSH